MSKKKYLQGSPQDFLQSLTYTQILMIGFKIGDNCCFHECFSVTDKETNPTRCCYHNYNDPKQFCNEGVSNVQVAISM